MNDELYKQFELLQEQDMLIRELTKENRRLKNWLSVWMAWGVVLTIVLWLVN